MTIHHWPFITTLIITLTLVGLPDMAFGEGKKKESPKSTATEAQEADVQMIKQKYWARGGEAAVGVVQNRLFTKKRKLELGINYDTINGDPFLTTRSITATAGYHFNELYSAHLILGKALVGPSTALETLERQIGTTANTNEPKFFVSGEARASVLYGKVSLLGLRILHFDAYAAMGLGLMGTESGNNFLFTFGVGQLLHITQVVSLSLAFKIIWYRERILGKVGGTNGNLGQDLGTRSNLSSLMIVGISFLLDPTSDKKQKPGKKP